MLTLVSSQPEPEVAAAPPRPKRKVRRMLAWLVGVAGVLAILVATGYAIFEQVQEKAASKRSEEARRLAELDSPLALRRALGILGDLRQARPRDGKVALTRAEILAALWGRFEGTEAARTEARQALAEAKGLRTDDERMASLEAHHLLFEGRNAEAARVAESALLVHRSSARLGYVLGMARLALGDLTAASATLKLAANQASQFLPGWVALARVQRLRGRLEAADQSVDHVLSRSAQHPGALVEQALLRQARGEVVDAATLHRLIRQVHPYPPLLAMGRLVLGRNALAEGEFDEARALFQQAALVAPEDPEIGLALLESQLLRGGDFRQAWVLHGALMDRTRELPSAAVALAETALGTGRPEEALRFLRRAAPVGVVPESVNERERVVRVQAAWELDQPEAADRLCREVWKSKQPGALSQEACLLHAARRRHRLVLDRQAKGLRGRLGKLAAALGLYARHRYDRAVEALIPLARDGRTTGWTLIILADALQRVDRPRAALPFLEQAVGQEAGSLRSRLALARGYQAAHGQAKALPGWSELLNEKAEGPRTMLEIGELGLDLAQYEAVEQLATRLERMHQTSGHAAYLRGQVAIRGQRDRRRARAQYEASQMREPGHLPSKLGLARLAFELGDVDGGRQLLDEAFDASGRSPEITLFLAREAFEANRIEMARQAYVKAALGFRVLGATYRASEVLAELGHRLSGIKSYRHRSVLRVLRWALRLNAKPARAHLRMGQFLEARGKHDEALACYQRATRLGPELAEAFFHRGALLLATRGEPQQVIQALGRYLDLTRAPKGRNARNAKAWLSRIQSRRRYLAAKNRS